MIENIIYVLISNFTALLSSVIVGLVIPKLMGVVDYGYYKIFVLYGTYISLFHFGFNDGILLQYGGRSIANIDKDKFRTSSQAFIFLEFILSIVVFTFGIFKFHNQYQVIFMALGINTFLTNVLTYYQFLTQAIERFDVLSKINSAQSVLTVLAAVAFFILMKLQVLTHISYYIYVVTILLINFVTLSCYAYRYQNITFGHRAKFCQIKKDWFSLFKLGFPITISYQVAALVLNLDNQYISLLFSTRTFGYYSFAYSLISMVNTVITAASTVLFPHLNKQKKEIVIKNYEVSVTCVLILVYAMMLAYYPLTFFIHLFLSEYNDSLVYFRVLFPIVGITSTISLVNFNYFKVFRKGTVYFFISIFILGIAALSNWIAYLLFRTPMAIAVSTLLVTFLWYILTEFYFVKKYHVKWLKNTLYMAVSILNFEITSNVESSFLGAMSYLIIYLLITYILYKKEIHMVKHILTL